MNKKIEKEIIETIKSLGSDMNPKWDSSRGKEKHVRVTQNGNLEKIKSAFNCNIKKEYNTKYSSSYYTLILQYKGQEFPMIISHQDLKRTKDKIITKSLTPSSLGVFGSYTSVDTLINDVIRSLKKKNLRKDIKTLLFNLINIAKEGGKLTGSSYLVYEDNYRGINKDFGEVLVIISKLKEDDIISVQIPEESNNGLYDLVVEYKDTSKEMINIKSESGSGQSFKTIPQNYINESLNNPNFYSKNSIFEKFLKVINLFTTNCELGGREKHLESARILSTFDDKLGRVLKDISKEFYNKDFNELKFENMNLLEYHNRIEKILKKENLDLIGVPKGTRHQTLVDGFKTPKSLEDALIFSISTIISKYHDDTAFDKLVKKMLTNNIVNISIKKNKKIKSFNIEEIKDSRYKIHYWGNSKSPTNNLLGYKLI